jgi:hypothetical protein
MRDLEPILRLRLRLDRDAAALARRTVGLAPSGQPAFVGRVVSDAKQPTVTGAYYLVNPVSVLGAEAEGVPAALVADATRTALLCVIGTQSPSPGDDLICRFVGNRWVAERYGATSPPPPPPPPPATIPGCSCAAIPTTLTMSSSGPCVVGDFQPCTIAWQPTPPEFSGLGLGANCFLSTATFVDPFSGGTFRYHLGCGGAYLSLNRVYEPSPDGTAYSDSTIYTWMIGASGNSCSPFLLSNGTIYPGGNNQCHVTISE